MPVSATDLAVVRAMCKSGEAKRLRLAAKLSQPEMGRDGDGEFATGSVVHRWENGDRTPTGEAAVRYLKQLRKLARLEAVSLKAPAS